MSLYNVIGGDKKQYGPATAEEIREWITDGRLNGQSLINVDGSPDWVLLETRGEFFAALNAVAPPPLLPVSIQASLPTVDPAPESARTFRIASCFARSFTLIGEHATVILVSALIVGMTGFMLELLPVAGAVYWVLKGVLFGGLSIVFLKLIRGEPASPADTFQGFHRNFPQLMLVGVISSTLTNVAALFLLIPGIYLGVCWVFAVPLAADRGLDFWPAMELSRKTVNRSWFKVFALLALAFLPYIVMSVYTEFQIIRQTWPILQEAWSGTTAPDLATLMQKLNKAVAELVTQGAPLLLGTKLAFVFVLPFAYGALMYAYEDLFGPRKPRSD